MTSAPPDRPHRLARSAGLVGLATMTSRVLGLVRDQVLAFFFGAGNAMDAFNVAFRIPNLVRDLFAEGAMSAAFVPTFTRYLTRRGRTDAWRLGNQTINALLLATGALVVLGIVFAEPLTRVMAGEYALVAGKLELTATLTRVMLPFLTLIAVAVAFMGMLNALGWFFIPALAPAMFNVATIACVMALAPAMHRIGWDPTMAIAIGTLAGGVGQIALQWPALRREGFGYRLQLNPRDEGLREVLRLMGPGTVGLAAVQINLFVNVVLATGEGTGAVSWLNYAFRLMYLPIGLFGVSIATAALPEISRRAAHEDLAGMRRTISGALRMMLMLNVPATVGLVSLADPIVAAIFERGRFTAADTAATALALQYYAPGLIGYSAVKVASPSFYALRDSRTPVIVSVVSVAVNVALNLALVRVLGYRGLALGTGLAALVNAGTLLFLLRRRIGGLEGGRLTIALAKITAASLLMAAVAIVMERTVAAALGNGLGRLVALATAIGVALATLVVSARLLRIEEFEEALTRVLSRVMRKTPS
jgi:putative peptidoglycan lipid II flippase